MLDLLTAVDLLSLKEAFFCIIFLFPLPQFLFAVSHYYVVGMKVPLGR